MLQGVTVLVLARLVQSSYLSRISRIIYMWRKFCHVEKFQISVKNLNNLWRFIEIYAVVLDLCGKKIRVEKK